MTSVGRTPQPTGTGSVLEMAQLQELILRPRLVTQFHALRKHTAQMTGEVLPFLLEVSNRGPRAQEVYELL